MPNVEKIVVRAAAPLFILAAVLEVIGRLRHRPDLHDVARWVGAAGLFVVLIPIVAVAAVLSYQAFFGRNKGHNGS
jgi:hypothetical protein